LFFYYSVFLR